MNIEKARKHVKNILDISLDHKDAAITEQAGQALAALDEPEPAKPAYKRGDTGEKGGIIVHVGKKGKRLEVYHEDVKGLMDWTQAMTDWADDWRLPTRKEFRRMVASGLVTLADDWYWTGEESAFENRAIVVTWSEAGDIISRRDKSELHRVRAVRTFKGGE